MRGEIAVVGVAAGIRLVHPEGTGLAAFGAGAEIVLRDTAHRVQHRITEREKALLLLAQEWRELCIRLIVVLLL